MTQIITGLQVKVGSLLKTLEESSMLDKSIEITFKKSYGGGSSNGMDNIITGLEITSPPTNQALYSESNNEDLESIKKHWKNLKPFLTLELNDEPCRIFHELNELLLPK